MNKMRFLRFPLLLLCGAMLLMNIQGCSDDDNSGDNEVSVKEELFKAAITPYVNNTVIPTYKGMADNSILLAKACNEIYTAFQTGTLTSDLVKKAGEYWNESRAYWERSEAFLYGAVEDYRIDPHIDSWPLDKNAMEDLLAKLRKGETWTIDNNAGYGLLGFHAVEYMLFELSADGKTSLPHNLNYTKEELIYLCIVAEDLRDQCVLLEASWAGMDGITSEKRQILEDAELEPTFDYGWSMLHAGQGGSRYKNYQEAAEDLIQGCIDIADEVGKTKIGRPANASADDEEDKNYIESPYSLNSITDFVDNIISIRNAYQGSKEGDESISDYIKRVNADLDARVKAQIQAAIAAIQAIPEPFAQTASGAAADNAVKVVGTDLQNVLQEVMEALSFYDL